MTDQVTELAPGDIQRGIGISTASPQPQGQDAAAAPAAPMGEAQAAAIAQLGDLRRQAADPSLNRTQRDAVMQKMSELSRHAFLGSKAPAWYGDGAPDPRSLSTEPHDSMAAALGSAAEALSEADREHLVLHAKVKGLDPAKAAETVEFCTKAGLDKTTAKIVTTRIAQHTVMGWGTGPLTQEEHADLDAECNRLFGSAERAAQEGALAVAYLDHVGLTAWAEKNAGSLQYDPQIRTMLAFKARSLGLKGA